MSGGHFFLGEMFDEQKQRTRKTDFEIDFYRVEEPLGIDLKFSINLKKLNNIMPISSLNFDEEWIFVFFHVSNILMTHFS